MKTEIKRTSIWGEGKPCDEAMYDGRWELELNSLEDLMAFTKKYGPLVVSDKYIEIYDDYRE